MLLIVRTTPRAEARRPTEGMTLFLAKVDREHIDVQPIPKLGRNVVTTNMVYIDDLFVPDEDRIGEEGRGFRYLLDGLNPERILVSAECLGIGRAALKRAVDYAKTRQVFGRPIGQNQGVQFPLAESLAKLDAAELLMRKAAWLYDSGRDCAREANAAKLLCSTFAFETADRAIQDTRRIRLHHRVPRRTLLARGTTAAHHAHRQRTGAGLPRRACPRAAPFLLSTASTPGRSAMPGLYFEQFEVGKVYHHSMSRTVTETDNLLFTALSMNTQQLHLDEEFAKKHNLWAAPGNQHLHARRRAGHERRRPRRGYLAGQSGLRPYHVPGTGVYRRHPQVGHRDHGQARVEVAAGRRDRHLHAQGVQAGRHHGDGVRAVRPVDEAPGS